MTSIPIAIHHRFASAPAGRIRRLIPQIVKRESSRQINRVGIVVLSDRRIRTLNRRYLDHDVATDVITFDLSEGPASPIDGEIYISYDRARVQARRFGVTTDNEILRLVAHGVLHLLGHDDATASDRRKMLELGDRHLLRSSA